MGKKKKQRCPFPKCRRMAEHDGEHSVRSTKGSGNRGKNPKSLANLQAHKFQPGVSGNPGGRPKRDLAAELAVAVFEENFDSIKKAFARKLKQGSLGVFQGLADRGFGPVPTKIIGGEDPILVKIDC